MPLFRDIGHRVEEPVFLEQVFLDVVAEVLTLVVPVLVATVVEDFSRVGKLVDRSVGEQDLVEGLAAVFRLLVDQPLGPDFPGLETLSEFHDLPQVRLGLARCRHLLAPELGAPLSVAVGTLLLYPHGGGQDQILHLGGDRRIGIGDGDEVVQIALAGIHLLVDVGSGLHVVVA